MRSAHTRIRDHLKLLWISKCNDTDGSYPIHYDTHILERMYHYIIINV